MFGCCIVNLEQAHDGQPRSAANTTDAKWLG
jgi:hypothetical protein